MDMADTSVSGDAADPDGDGLANLVEYALGLDPTSADPRSGLRIAPVSAAGGDVEVSLVRRAELVGVNCVLEVSGDLKTWLPAAGFVTDEQVAANADGVTETLTLRVRSPREDGTRGFVRLRVVRDNG
jgi:hypothetical protein